MNFSPISLSFLGISLLKDTRVILHLLLSFLINLNHRWNSYFSTFVPVKDKCTFIKKWTQYLIIYKKIILTNYKNYKKKILGWEKYNLFLTFKL